MKLRQLFTDAEAWQAVTEWQHRSTQQQVRAHLARQERAMCELLQAAHAAGRVPRYVWRRHPDWQPTWGDELHSGDSMPEGGPWIVYTITPAAVAMALGMP